MIIVQTDCNSAEFIEYNYSEMQAIKLIITEFIDDWLPGWVECYFTDSWGIETIDGLMQFEILEDQIIEFNDIA